MTAALSRSLEGKVVLVTGGGSGIGRASSVAFARAGACVVVSDIDSDGGAETARLIAAAGGTVDFVAADVARPQDVADLVATVVARHGRLDCAHNNAGIGPGPGATHEIADEQWGRVLAVNLTGVWLCMKHELAQMLVQGGGAIVNTASVMGLVGGVGSPYVAAKHGVVGLTKQAALEYAQRGIRINAVCPGPIRTKMVEDAFSRVPGLEERWTSIVPAGRVAAPEEIAWAVVWLCTEAASFVTGIALPVDGGWVAQ